MRFFSELKRRNVLRASALYIGAAWALSQGLAQLLPVFDIPNWVTRWFVIAAIIGFPFAMFFSWFYEWTPQGIQRERNVEPDESIARETGKRLDRWIIVVLSLAVVLLLANTFVLHKDENTATATQALGKSIAVLPFENRSADKDNEYFASGMQDMILTKLAAIGDLKVISRTSTEKYSSHPDNLKTIALQLGVATILEGSVQKSGNAVLINTQLINANTDAHLWAEAYPRTLDNIFGVEGEVAQKVADALKAKLTPTESASVASVPTRDPEAYDLYLQGVFFSNKSTEDGLRHSVDLFERSLLKDPANPHAWSGIAKDWNWLSDAYVRPLDAYPQSKAAALKALALDRDNAAAHAYLGDAMRVLDRDVAGAERETRRALQLNPNSSDALLFLALLRSTEGDPAEGIALIQQALKIDPLSPIISNFAALIYLCTGRYDDAIAAAEQTQRLDENYFYLSPFLADTYREQGRYPEAISAYRKAEQATGQPQSGLAVTYARMKHTADARRILAELENKAVKSYVSGDEIAAIYVALGDNDDAFRWLQRAFDEHAAPLHGIGMAPRFRPLHKDPRFSKLLVKLGLDPQRILAKDLSGE